MPRNRVKRPRKRYTAGGEARLPVRARPGRSERRRVAAHDDIVMACAVAVAYAERARVRALHGEDSTGVVELRQLWIDRAMRATAHAAIGKVRVREVRDFARYDANRATTHALLDMARVEQARLQGFERRRQYFTTGSGARSART